MKKIYLFLIFFFLLLSFSQSVQALDITEYRDAILNWHVTPYKTYLGDFVWMLLFTIAIGVTWGITKDPLSTLAVILITFACFGGSEAYLGEPGYSLMFAAFAAICLAAGMSMLFKGKKHPG